MNKYRVIRGTKKDGKLYGFGYNYTAATPADAVKQDNAYQTGQDHTMGGLIAPVKLSPVIAVYALTLVPESEWT